jgi:hypothetical protein
MAEPIEPGGYPPPPSLRLTSGFELFERWSHSATQVEKNIVHQVLFAVTDRSVFKNYMIVDDLTQTMEFFVLCRCDLTVKIRVHDFETCGITYIGPICSAPGLDQAKPDALSAEPTGCPEESASGQEESASGQEEGHRARSQAAPDRETRP